MASEESAGLSSELKVFEAWYGDQRGALTLLHCPEELRDFFIGLSDKSDLPDLPPPGSTWEPFVRGWAEEDFYVVARTTPDRAAARPGMVFTRMLAIRLADATNLKSLSAVFAYLQTAQGEYSPEHNVGVAEPNPEPNEVSTLVSCVAYRLLRQQVPVAVVGQSHYEDLIAAFWRKIPPSLRGTLKFGFSFTPADVATSRQHIVAVPTSCAPRWREWQWKCDVSGMQPFDNATAALLDSATAEQFQQFLEAIGLQISAFADYNRFARLWHEWQHRLGDDEQLVYSLIRSLGTALPNPEDAKEQKVEALRLASTWIRRSSAEGVLAQRSVKADAFPGNCASLGDAIAEWIGFNVTSTAADYQLGLIPVLSAVPSSQSPTWQVWIRRGVSKALDPLNAHAASVLWAIARHHAAFVELFRAIPADPASEQVLIANLSRDLESSTYKVIEELSVERHWFELAAHAILRRAGFAQAAQFVLRHTSAKSAQSILQSVAALASPDVIWEAAFEIDDSLVRTCAARSALRSPNLWTAAASDPVIWLSILDSAARTQPEFLRLFDSGVVVTKVLNAISEGLEVSTALLEAVERANGLDFFHYQNRAVLWPALPSRFRQTALRNTLRSWLRDFYSTLPAAPYIEKELVEILFERDNLSDTFPRNSRALGPGGLMLVERWGREVDLQSWLFALSSSAGNLAAGLAERAGNLILEREWSNAARIAKYLDDVQRRHDLRPVWTPYARSLGRLEKFLFEFSSQFRLPSSAYTSVNPTSSAEAAFITALPEEFAAVCAHLSERQEYVEGGTLYELGRFGDDGCTVAVVQTGAGNAPAAAATERMLSLFRPQFAFFVGIAGGLREELQIGDVVVADKVYGYEGGKAGSKFQPRPEATNVSHEALQRAYAVLRSESWQQRIHPPPSRVPVAVVKPIAAGEKVVVSERSETLRRIRATYTDAYAVAMEEHGFSVATRGHPSVCFAVVRGISDLIENKREADLGGSHEIAARNAAAFALEMLSGLLSARLRNAAAR